MQSGTPVLAARVIETSRLLLPAHAGALGDACS